MKPIEAVIHRQIIGTVSSLTITRTSTGKYYAAIRVDDSKEATVKDLVITKVIGWDKELSDYVITSNDYKIANPSFLMWASDNLCRKQKALSRKHKERANRDKSTLPVAKCHLKATDAQADLTHKISRLIIDDNPAIIVEAQKSANMIATL